MHRRIAYPIIFLVTLLLVVVSYNIASIWVDPFGIVRPQQTKPARLWGDARRYLVVEHLREHQDEYQGFIIANSRGYFLSASTATQHSKLNFYNMSFSAETLYGYADHVRWLLKAQRPQSIIILLSFDQFSMGDSRKLTLVTREHPAVSGESWLTYYFAFANDLPTVLLHNNLSDALYLGHRVFANLMPGLGQYVSPYGAVVTNCCNTDISTGDIHGWSASPSSMKGDPGPWGAAPKSETRDAEFGDGARAHELDQTLRVYWTAPFDAGAVAGFQGMMANVKKSHTQFSCVVAPISARALRFVDPERYVRWLAMLVRECGSIWDFSDRNSITANKDNYLDWSHFLAPVGNLVLQRIFRIQIGRAHV